MTTGPSRATAAGTAYLDLRKLAQDTGRPTDELLQLYALEGFLDRLTSSQHAHDLVLKGGVLLAAFDTRRPTRDIDFAAIDIDGDLASLRTITNAILSINLDDGLKFDPTATTIESIRDEDSYSGARAKISGTLSTAQIRFHVDFNFGDPLWPTPQPTQLPRLLGGPPINILGCRVELILAEKIITALQRGTANTRWRDFVDIAELARRDINSEDLAESIRRVAAFRQVQLSPLSNTLEGFGEHAQSRWAAWRRKQQLNDTPESFAALLDIVIAFSDQHLGRVQQ